MEGKEKREYAILVTSDPGPKYGHVYTKVVQVENNEPRNICSEWDNPPRNWLDDLIAGCQIDTGKAEPPYGFEAYYSQPYRVDAERAKRMATTLATIKRGLDRLGKERGSVESFGDYVLRVATVLGIKKAFFFRGARVGANYSDNRYIITSAAEAKSRINEMVRDLSEAGRD